MTAEQDARRWRDEGLWRTERLTDYVRRWAAETPDRDAVVDGDRRVTWAQLLERARAAAAALQDLGVAPGDVVSTQMPNSLDMVVLHLGVELAGAVHNPLAVQFRQHELDQIGGILQPRLVVHPGVVRGVDYAEIHAATEAGRSGRVVSAAEIVGRDLRPGAPESSPSSAQDAAFILNTSGTVAIKGVVHTHEEAIYSTRTVAELLQLGRDDTVVCAIPMTWGGGLAWGVRIALTIGATLVSMERWDPAVATSLIDGERARFIYGPPTLARDIVLLADHWRPSEKLTMICAGAPIPRQLCRDARDRLGMQLIPGYGQTEHLHSTLGRLDDSLEKITTTDGRCLPGVELIAVDDDGNRVGPGVAGDLLCRGPNVAAAYYRQPELSAGTFRPDGWQVTQDVGSFDADGHLKVEGRKRDLIIRGGLNVSPREVEELLMRHSAVAEVAVVGVPDARYGERICAFIVPRGGAAAPSLDELTAMLTEMGVARYKHPERVEAIAAMPQTTTGKVRHQSLRELLAAET
jgi:acyl-CoA synthetase (AMP-forming)/AMP-acid ligase II